MENVFQNYLINDDREKTDLEFVHRELSQSYWAKNIPVETVRRGIENSVCFNVFLNAQQIGFARVITDKSTFGYLCDVIVNEQHRGKGLGKALMQFIMAHPDLQGFRRFTLGTRDAHGLYEQFGFHAPKFPDRLMEISRPGLYEKKENFSS
jgi:GNAT superfamily N-acetyltransferase